MKLLALGISADFFRTLGVQPALGRDFVAKEPGDHVILSDALWHSRFNADPSVIGRACFRILFLPSLARSVRNAGCNRIY